MNVTVDFAKRKDRPNAWIGFNFNPQIISGISYPIQSIAYGQGTFVVVANGGGLAATAWSYDGFAWNIVNAPNALQYQSIAYGQGVFIAVAQTGGGNQIIRSVDRGKTWSAIAEPSTRQWRSICFCGNATFVAVAQDGVGVQIMRSTDLGLTWASIAEPSTRQWQSVYANQISGVVCAVAQDGVGNQIMRSTDRGATWASIAEPQTELWQAVTYGNSLWMAVSNGSAAFRGLMTSVDDGATWSWKTVPNLNYTSVAWCYDKFIIPVNGGTSWLLTREGDISLQVNMSSRQNLGKASIAMGDDRAIMAGYSYSLVS